MARGNQFEGKVTKIVTGGVMAAVTVAIGNGLEVVWRLPPRQPNASVCRMAPK